MKRSASTKHLCNDSFLSGLKQFSNSKKFWIACSGGMDSIVLLHLFYSNKSKITQAIEVLYVNHGLQKEADGWGTFCQEQSQKYGFSFTQLKITGSCPKGESIEGWAREERYALIEDVMNDNDVLFTAHHQDDQVETFFLQALRGAGPRGLASMPITKTLGNTFHYRPLLNYSREEINVYAKYNKLVWQEDKSNSDVQYDRNYFRHNVAPVIEKRWPAYRDTVSRLINNQKEYKALLDEVASTDFKLAQYKNEYSLNLDVVKKLSLARQKNLIFFWIKALNLKTPGFRNIEKIITDVFESNIEQSPCVNWENVEVRRYKNIVYLAQMKVDHNVYNEFSWNPESVLNLSNETLIAESTRGKGISKLKMEGNDFIVRYRQGGEKIYPNDLSQSKTIKQLFQEKGVLPWLRDSIPLIYVDGELALIPGFCVDVRYLAEDDEASWDIHWSGYESVIQ